MKLELTYQDIEAMTDTVAKQAQEGNFDGMLIITRGGLVPGYLLATRLKIRNIHCIALSSYTDGNRGEIKEVDGVQSRDFSGENWLIVDDLSDSGQTLKYVTEKYFQNVRFKVATLITKVGTEYKPDYYAYEVPKEQWIVFPYEQD